MSIQFSTLPLKIHGYFFPESQINYTAMLKADDQFCVSKNLTISTSVTPNKERPETLEITVRVKTVADAPPDKPYNLEFDICALGFFENMDKKTEITEEVKNIIHANGAAILIGAIRERLASSTASSPFGIYILPSIRVNIAHEETTK